MTMNLRFGGLVWSYCYYIVVVLGLWAGGFECRFWRDVHFAGCGRLLVLVV